MPAITTAQIQALRTSAAEAGDLAMVAICLVALHGVDVDRSRAAATGDEWIAAIERAKAAAPVREPIISPAGLYAIVEDRDLNRCQIRFDARVSPAVAAALKARGFRWAPSENAWQRQASNAAWYAAKTLAAAIDAGELVP